MSHTPDQARGLWCPMVRIARRENTEPSGDSMEVTVAGCNSDALGGMRVPASCRCIADQCAMWRWAVEPPTDAVSVAEAGLLWAGWARGVPMTTPKLTKADTVALWHAVDWMGICLQERCVKIDDVNDPAYAEAVRKERDHLKTAKSALRKVNALRRAQN